MNERRDPLEEELESVRLPEVSAALRARIAQSLEEAPMVIAAPRHRTSPVRWMLAGALAAAAVLAVSLVWFRSGDGSHPVTEIMPVVPHPMPTTTPVRVRSAITLAAYTRAAAGSSDELDTLLDADAARPLGLNPSDAPSAFARSLDDLKQ